MCLQNKMPFESTAEDMEREQMLIPILNEALSNFYESHISIEQFERVNIETEHYNSVVKRIQLKLKRFSRDFNVDGTLQLVPRNPIEGT